MDSLYWDWQSKYLISIDENCQMTSSNPVISDSVYIDRLSRIPSVIEMPFNDIVKKHIEAYTGRLKNHLTNRAKREVVRQGQPLYIYGTGS